MTGGVITAVDEALDAFEEEAADAQALLFDDLEPGEIGALDAPSPLTEIFKPRSRAGRKPGSRNKRTEAVTAWLLSQARHPVLVAMEGYSMSTVELAARIGITNPDKDMLFDLFKLQMHLVEVAARYVAQPQPQAVQLDGKGWLTIS